MIEPLEAVIAYLKADTALTALVSTRIAAKHRYGTGMWTPGTLGLTVKLDGGSPDLYLPLQVVRLEVRCYGSSWAVAMPVWTRLVELSRDTRRERVAMFGASYALLHTFSQASGPSLLHDPDVDMDLVLAFFEAAVGEQAVN